MGSIKVSAKSSPGSVAGAIAGMVKSAGSAEVEAIGAAATNQAVKSIAIARGFLATCGAELICYPYFASVELNGKEKTAIKMQIEIK